MKLSFRKYGNGKPLFILHGLFGSSDNWQTLGKQFSARFSVYLIDFRNHGQSPHSNDFSYELMSEDIHELMEDEGIEKVMLLGHSLGGKVAMYFTFNSPEKVEKLVVADIAPKEYPVTHQSVIDALEQFNPQTLSSRKEAEEILATYIAEKETRQFLLKNLYWDENQKLRWRFNFESIKNNITNVGEAIPFPSEPIDIPVLFVKGENSNYIFPEDIALINSMFPRAYIEVIPAAGHWVHADQPQIIFQKVMNFLNS